GTTDDPEDEEACMVFYKRHLCRLDDWPQEMVDSFGWIAKDPTVYHTMNGPSEFHVIGSIKDWQSKDRLGEISVPTLLTSGRYDEATPALQEPLRDGIPDCEWVLFEESSHTPFVEEREHYMQVVGDWLARHDYVRCGYRGQSLRDSPSYYEPSRRCDAAISGSADSSIASAGTTTTRIGV